MAAPLKLRLRTGSGGYANLLAFESQCPMMSVIIPAYNEETIICSSVTRLHEYLERRGIEHEVIIVDNGSTDRTGGICKELASQRPWLRCFSIPQRGVGRAFVLGATHARGDCLVSVDADLPSELAFLDYADKLLDHCHLLVGSKFMGYQNRPLLRVLGSQLYVMIAQLCFGLTVSDFSPDSKAYRRSSLAHILPHLDPWTGYVLEVALHFKRTGKRVLQIGIDVQDSRPSKFHLLHEAMYRYRHLFRCWLLERKKNCWLGQDAGARQEG